MATVYSSIWFVGFWYLKFIVPVVIAMFCRVAIREAKTATFFGSQLAFLIAGALVVKDAVEFLTFAFNVREFVIW
jgi:hypothetical protein